tara:strand:+ start:835 stop:1098 length:264 start_codon:yes stop_codon:yes gene_type:complete
MFKVLNIFFLLIILFFAWSTFKYYSSSKNIKIKDFNRNNINQIINNKMSNIPTLKSDTNNVIEFNNSIANEVIKDKPRSFWKLLKIK